MILSGMSSSWLNNLGQLMSVLAIFLIVLLLTWLVTRWIAGYQQGQMQNQNLRVVETLRLTTNNYIQIIEAGDVYLVLAVSKDHVEKIAQLDKEQLNIHEDSGSGQKMGMGMNFQENFHDIFDKVKQHLPKK